MIVKENRTAQYYSDKKYKTRFFYCEHTYKYNNTDDGERKKHRERENGNRSKAPIAPLFTHVSPIRCGALGEQHEQLAL